MMRLKAMVRLLLLLGFISVVSAPFSTQTSEASGENSKAELLETIPESQTLPPANADQKNKMKPKKSSLPKPDLPKQDLRGTETSPFLIKVLPPVTIEHHSTEQHSTEPAEAPANYMSPEWWLVYITGLLAVITGALATYTWKLWRATKTLAEDAKQTAERQAREMTMSLQIAQESADASVAASMPVLSPLIVGGNLHPLPDTPELSTLLLRTLTLNRMCTLFLKISEKRQG
jgi:hypothetical protein